MPTSSRLTPNRLWFKQGKASSILWCQEGVCAATQMKFLALNVICEADFMPSHRKARLRELLPGGRQQDLNSNVLIYRELQREALAPRILIPVDDCLQSLIQATDKAVDMWDRASRLGLTSVLRWHQAMLVQRFGALDYLIKYLSDGNNYIWLCDIALSIDIATLPLFKRVQRRTLSNYLYFDYSNKIKLVPYLHHIRNDTY